MTNTNIPDTAVDNLTDGSEDTAQTVDDYMPTFGDNARTIIYIVALVASIVSLGFMYFGEPTIGSFISIATGVLTGGFGVVYSPVRMADEYVSSCKAIIEVKVRAATCAIHGVGV